MTGDNRIVVGDGLGSCTKVVESSSVFEVQGHTVELVDTPGFNDDEMTDTDVLKLIADWMEKKLVGSESICLFRQSLS